MKLEHIQLVDGNILAEKYNKSSLESIAKHLQEAYNTDGPILGELGRSERSDLYTDLKDVSHTIDNIYVENNNLYGDINILHTPCGQNLEKLISAGYKPTIAPRGTVDENGNVIIKTFDFI